MPKFRVIVREETDYTVVIEAADEDAASDVGLSHVADGVSMPPRWQSATNERRTIGVEEVPDTEELSE